MRWILVGEAVDRWGHSGGFAGRADLDEGGELPVRIGLPHSCSAVGLQQGVPERATRRGLGAGHSSARHGTRVAGVGGLAGAACGPGAWTGALTLSRRIRMAPTDCPCAHRQPPAALDRCPVGVLPAAARHLDDWRARHDRRACAACCPVGHHREPHAAGDSALAAKWLATEARSKLSILRHRAAV